MRGVYTWARALLIAAGAAVAVSAARDIPKGFWTSHDTLFWVAIWLGVVATAIDPIINRLGWRKETKKAIRRSDGVRSALAVLLMDIIKLTDADWRTTGVFAYRARCPRIPVLRILQPVGHVRLKRLDPMLPPPKVRYDHGMVGTTWASDPPEAYSRFWKQESEQLHDELTAKVGKHPLPKWKFFVRAGEYRWRKNMIKWRCWRKIDKEHRWRLRYSEFQSSRHYHILVTYPIRDPTSGRVAGVLSVDVRPNPDPEGPDIKAERLEQKDVVAKLNRAALGVYGAFKVS
ncbi:hypothetical protein [Streptomyces sp. NPDC002676]